MAFCDIFLQTLLLGEAFFYCLLFSAIIHSEIFLDNLEFLQVKKISENTHKRSKNNEQQRITFKSTRGRNI